MAHADSTPGHPPRFWRGGRTVAFALLLVLAAIALRWPGLDRQIWNLDEGSTFTMAQIVRDGGVLYRDAADNRTPLVPYAKALIFAVIGDWNIRGAHLIVAALLGFTAVWLWRIGRAAGDADTGVLGAVFFTFLSFVMLTVMDTMSAHTGWFLVFFSSVGMWAFIVAWHRQSLGLAGVAGAAFALAALAKQPGLLDCGTCLVICALGAWTEPSRWRRSVRLTAGLVLGFIIPLGLTFAYFNVHDAWDDFLRYTNRR